ncbi:MAG: hypothetical protein CMN32_16750 [Saprospirales bacterium]|nr:hypothetical protein [Saprospirales bacterium]
MRKQSFLFFAISLAGFCTSLHAQQCLVTGIDARIIKNCNDNGTVPEWEDDYFEAELIVRFDSVPENGYLVVAGPLLDTIRWPVGQLNGQDSLALQNLHFKASQKTYREYIRLSAWFTADPSCVKNVRSAGIWRDHDGVTHRNIKAPQICSVCVGPPGSTGGKLPDCFPPEIPDPEDPCSDVTNYAPDPARPEDTPIQYVKMVLHIFQREHPDSLGKHVLNLDDPGNYTSEHLEMIRSWFTDPEGINGFFQAIPDDPADGSIHIPDARIRFLNLGIEGVDVFFHPDNRAWGMGYSCEGKGTTGYYSKAVSRYLLNPDSALLGERYYRALKSDDVRQAMHVFIAGASWFSDDQEDAEPDSTDCIWYCTQGYSSSRQACFDPAFPPVYVISGSYYTWLSGQGVQQDCGDDYPGSDAALSRQMIGEFLHLLSLDHISPFQAHWKHLVGGDGCEDTPLQSELNRMGCADPKRRVVLTQCQIGRMHYLLQHLQPGYLRYPQPDGSFASQKTKSTTEPDLRIRKGEVVRWAGKRELRSNVVVESGGRLIINCDIGLPANARITSEPGGQVLLEGGMIYRVE